MLHLHSSEEEIQGAVFSIARKSNVTLGRENVIDALKRAIKS